MRALAEQVLDELGVRAGETVCDLMCDGGALTALLSAQGAHVIAVDTSPGLTAAAAQEAGGRAVEQVCSDGRQLEIAAGACDAVASLLTIGFGDASSLLRESMRVLRQGGRLGVVSWDAEQPPPHLRELRSALGDAGHESAFLAACLPVLDLPRGLSVRHLDDVARFDGVAQMWSAVVDDTLLGAEVQELPDGVRVHIRQRVDDALSAYAGADGTLRIPVRALLITR